jgi:hypothetical protein
MSHKNTTNLANLDVGPFVCIAYFLLANLNIISQTSAIQLEHAISNSLISFRIHSSTSLMIE